MGFRGVAPLVVISMMTVSAAAPATASGKEPLWIFFGANLGYTSVSPDSTIRESDRDGYAAHLKVLGSKYWSKWVADFGLGYQHHVASGKDEFSPLRDASVKVKTRSLFVELSPRYRVGPRWQVGAVVNGFFGTDVSFGESVVDDSSFALAAGARADYEKPGENQRWRYGLQIMHDLTVSNRGLWWVMADIQFGIPFSSGGSSTELAVAPEPAANERPKAPQFAEVTPEKNVKVYLGEAVVRFKTASAELDPMSHRILEKMTKYLKQAPDAWKKIRVEGHADKRGALEYNMRLSRRRAERVKKELIRLGIPAEKLSSEGFGPTRPIDPAEDQEAYTLNRRVELLIDGVNDAEAVVKDLNELQ